MIVAANLAGFYCAHAIWSVSSGETLVPMLALETEAGTPEGKARSMMRLALGEQSVGAGQAQLEKNEADANDAVLLFDARITVAGRQLDAIVLEMRCYAFPWAKATLAVPYSPKAGPQGFRVHRPKLLAWTDCRDFDQGAMFESFFEGVEQHPQGAKIWAEALDESV